MNPGFSLTLNGTPYSAHDLTAGVKSPHHTEFERVASNFCNAWLTGQEDFYIETSGSTGAPKKIILHRSQMEASARLTQKALGLREGFSALLCLDPRYIAGQMMLVRGMVTGMKIVAVEPCANPLEKVQEEQIDFSAFVPYQLHAILHAHAAKIKLSEFKCILVGGSALDAPTMRSLNDLRCQCYASYGMTETITHVALQKLNGEGKQDFFQALDGVTLSVDSRGCLVIHAQHLGEEAIVTHDLVDIIAPNQFRWLGRFDHVINSGGIKIIPEKIEKVVEHALLNLKITNRFFITSRPHEGLGEHVALMLEGELAKNMQEEIMLQLKSQLPRFEVPKSITLIAHFEQTNTGKIDRGKTLKNAFDPQSP